MSGDVTGGQFPTDEAAREQITFDHAHTLFVEAGAGTGKTSALVDRIVELVASGARAVRDLAVITFTEAAAAELADRVRRELEAAARGDGDPARSPSQRANCAEAVAALDEAAISTLHGFAQRVLADHPVEAGLPPGFEVLDDIQAAIEFDRRWDSFLDALLDNPELERALVVAFVFGLSPRRLEEVARELHRNWDRLEGPEPVVEPVPAPDARELVAALTAVVSRSQECLDPTGDKLVAHLEGLAPVRDRLAQSEDDEIAVLEALAAVPKLTVGPQITRAARWPDGCKAEIRSLLDEAQAVFETTVHWVKQAALHQLLAVLRRFVLHAVAERRAEGRLEFHDLLVMARDLLRSRPDVRQALFARYPALLLDEFQDTDPLQIEIALLIADAGGDAGDWWEAAPVAGSMFFVGDPKQSIYRFRRADIELYLRARDVFARGQLHLTRNFRSTPEIIDWVNATFSALMAAGPPDLQAPYEDLHATRAGLAGAPVPVVLLGGEVPKGSLLDELREREADEIAAVIAQAKTEEWPVHDPESDDPEATRPARYADIALLVPSRTTLPYLEDALERAGIPARVESQSLVFATAEVRDLLAVLTAVDDPTDEVALVAALRSPGFGCRDDELVEFRRAGGHWDYRRSAPPELPPEHPVVSGMTALGALHEQRWWETVSETVERIVRERRLFELSLAYRRPRDHWRRIRFFVDMARAFVDGGGTSVRSFVDWIEDQIEREARAVEVVVPEADDDAVRILTVHGAKGLEFPIVVLTGLNVGYQHRPGPVLWRDSHPEVRLGPNSGFETAGWAEVHERDGRADRAEKVRLLYVAATRARDHLVVSMHRRERDACAAAWLAEHAGGLGLARAMTAPGPTGEWQEAGREEEAVGVPHSDGDDVLAARARWRSERAERLAAGARAATVAATALAAHVAGDGALDPDLAKEPVEDEVPAWRRGRAGTSVGRAVHATLQSIALDTGDGLDDTARAQAWAEEVPAHEAEVRDLVRSVLDAPIVRAAVDGGRFWREVPVAVNIDGVTLEGFVDLLVETPEGLVVVDYKTDRAPGDDELDALMAKYRVQGAAYALALERVLGQPVARCVFVFSRRGEAAVERDVADLPAVVAEVEARVQAMA
ncbi:MAG: UvrD-helicase domain-containing protein [Acidimicrobiia bacterium]